MLAKIFKPKTCSVKLLWLLRAETELDQSARVRRDPGLPAIVFLELLHGGSGLGVPRAGGFAFQIALLDERGLDLGSALGWH